MKKALKIVFNVIAWVVLIFALLITILVFSSDKNNGTASLLGYVPLTVESDSMKPTFKKGDLIISKEIDDINSLKQGDVITFWTLITGTKVKNTPTRPVLREIRSALSTREYRSRPEASVPKGKYTSGSGVPKK